MDKMTITEALAETKTIAKRLEKKRQFVFGNIGRDARVKDSFEADGGSSEYLRRERQAIADLEKRLVSIRTSIQRSNLATSVAIGRTTMSVAEWLTFRREVAEGRRQFLAALNQGIKKVREQVQREGGRINPTGAINALALVEGAGKSPNDVILHLNERELIEEQEELEKTLGDLDGKLSLLNATTVVEI